jgi:cytochrome c-type biogenesis protein CcmH/NrfG
MRRDLLITALIFAAMGFLAGYLYSEHASRSSVFSPPPAPASPPPAEFESSSLPEGHPPLDLAQHWQELRQVAEANPGDGRAAINLANLLFDGQRWDDAVFWYRRGLELEGRNTDARTDLATCYYNLARFDEAAREYTNALRLEPEKPEALYGLALTRLRGKKDRAAAQQLYERLRRTHPGFPGVEQLAELLAQEQPR